MRLFPSIVFTVVVSLMDNFVKSAPSVFGESPLDVLLQSKDLSGLDKLIKSTWEIASCQEPMSSERSPLVAGVWDNTLVTRCTALARVNTAFYREQGMWSQLMMLLYPDQGPSRFLEFPYLTVCLLLPYQLPEPVPAIPAHWTSLEIFEILEKIKTEIRLTGADVRELTHLTYNTIDKLGFADIPIASVRLGLLDVLELQLGNLSTALKLQVIFTDADSIVQCTNPRHVLRFLLVNFPKRVDNMDFLQRLLIAAFESHSKDILDYIRINHADFGKKILIEKGSLDKPAICTAPLAFLRHMKEMRLFTLEALDAAAFYDREDVIEIAVTEFDRIFPTVTGIVKALKNGASRVITYLGGVIPGFFSSIIDIAKFSNDSDLDSDIVESGNLVAYKLLLKYVPGAFPPNARALEMANAYDHVDLIKFVYGKLTENLPLWETTELSPQTTADVQHAIGLASSNFFGLRSASPKVVRFFKNLCDEYGIPFPPVTMEVIVAALERDRKDFIDQYENVFGTPVPFLPEISQRGLRAVEAWHFDLFDAHGLSVTTSPDAVTNASLKPLSELKIVHQRLPGFIPIDSRFLCFCLEEGSLQKLQWALPLAEPGANFDGCNISDLNTEHLPVYKLANESMGWLPSPDLVDKAAGEGLLDIVQWAIKASHGDLYPSPGTVHQILDDHDVTMARLLHSLKPLDFDAHFYVFVAAAEMGHLKFLKWFPQLKEKLLELDRPFPADILSWLSKKDSDD